MSRNSQTGLLHICLLLQSLATVRGFTASLREAAVQPAALRTTRRLSPRRRPRWRADRAARAQILPACGLAPPVSETDVTTWSRCDHHVTVPVMGLPGGRRGREAAGLLASDPQSPSTSRATTTATTATTAGLAQVYRCLSREQGLCRDHLRLEACSLPSVTHSPVRTEFPVKATSRKYRRPTGRFPASHLL